MPNYKKHLTTGALVGLFSGAIINVIKQERRRQLEPTHEFNLGELMLYALGGSGIGALGGILPDLLEPAYSPHHRQVFHSFTCAISITVGLKKAEESNLKHDEKMILKCAGFGYLSHLLLDGVTPKGLPVI